jgi:acetyl-CoA carboxylase carboxyltransferase component
MGSREKMTGFTRKRASLDAARTEAGTCRHRIEQLLDEASFVELDSLVTARDLMFGAERKKVEGDGVLTGYGTLDGRRVFIASQDSDVFGGSMGKAHAEKIAKAVHLACDARVPFIGLYDTGGLRVEEGVLGLEGLGTLLAALDDASGQIPLVAGILGPCAGGAAFLAVHSDIVLMSEDGGGLYMNGPMVVSATENQSLPPETIGGASVHAEKTGLAMLTAPNEKSLIEKIKAVFAYLPDSSIGFTQPVESPDDPNRTESRLDDIAAALDQGYQMREVIDLVFDTDSVMELAENYAPGLITGLACLDGTTVGILAQTGMRLDRAMLKKAVRHTRMCEHLNFPVITLIDSEGYAISIEEEHNGLVDSGAELMRAMLRLSVPRITLVVGKAIGTAWLTLGRRHNGTDLVYAWPTAEIAVVNANTAAHILYRDDMASDADPASSRDNYIQKYAEEIASPVVAASLGHIDEVIMPSVTRPRLVSALDMLTTTYNV